MFESLGSAIDSLEVPIDGAALTSLVALSDRLQARLACAVAEFDAAAMWELDHATSLTAWLRSCCGMTTGAAASLARTGAIVGSLPVLSEAWRSGVVSSGQVAAVVAWLSARTVPLFASQEAELVPVLAPLSVRETVRAMQAWRERADALLDSADGAEPDPEPEPERSLHLSRTLDGRGELRGSLDAASTTVVEEALRLSSSPDADGERARVPSERRADALVDLCRWFLDHREAGGAGGGGRNRPHVNVVVSLPDVVAGSGRGVGLDGIRLDPASIRTLLCDSSVHRVVTDGRSTILDYGRATREISTALFVALALRDGHCRHPGCDRKPLWCGAHHVIPWEVGGPTNLANLVLKCSRHHHLGHRPGWSEKLKPDGTLVLTAPDGRVWETRPAGAVVQPELPELAGLAA
jgi:5-methylcytosine-specific restriction protein A